MKIYFAFIAAGLVIILAAASAFFHRPGMKKKQTGKITINNCVVNKDELRKRNHNVIEYEFVDKNIIVIY